MKLFNVVLMFSLAANAFSAGWPSKVFAPYMYIGADDHFQITKCDDACGQKFFTIAFIIADKHGDPAWDGTVPMGKNLYADQINAIRTRGGDVIVSFGGAGGKEIALVETNVVALTAKYQTVIDQYKLTWLDFDIEGGSLSKLDVNQRRNAVIAKLQAKNPGLRISYTLPVDPNGISDESKQLLNDAKSKGVKIYSVNVMTMDFGTNFSAGKKMSDLSIASTLKAHEQCEKIDPAIQIGVTPMIGQNDEHGEVFTPDDARVLKAWAETQPWICSLSFWASNRDTGKMDKDKTGNDTSGIEQKPWAFTLIFKSFTTALTIDVAAIDRDRILRAADAALKLEPITITKYRAKLSKGGPNDFYSEADYFWPNPKTPDGLPYVNRDGQSNPDLFSKHRMAMRNLRDAVAALAAAYKITGENRYATKAAGLLRVFFLDPRTRMNPNLQYAQAMPGASSGRSWGIIDGLHLIEIPPAITALEKSLAFTPELVAGLKQWFQEMADWMVTSKNGRAEAAARNNHSVAFWLQIACYARFTGDETKLAECRRQFKEVFVPNQMAVNGSFPLELKRTKPYGYSIFQLDNMATLCQMLSTSKDNLWKFELPDGRGISKAVAYLYPFLVDKSKWPLKPDVQAWDDWPARQSSLLFAGLAFNEDKYLELWRKLPADPTSAEVRRNIAITQPILWLQ
ncbi:MAG: alginate lyase family protein [Limisphaerales bacterium]